MGVHVYQLFWDNKSYILVRMERKNVFLVQIMEKLLLILLNNRSPYPNGVRIVGMWCSIPYTESKEALYSVPI